MQFKKDAPVYTSAGEQVGTIERVVLDPQTNEVSHLVIRQGWLFTEDKVIPIELIDTAVEAGIQLRSDVQNLDQLPLFEEVHYIPYEADTHAENTTAAATNPEGVVQATETPDDPTTTTTYSTVTDAFSLYGYPPIGLAWPAYDLGYYGYPDELYKVKVKRHIPTGTVALKEGAAVVDSRGDRVGTVKRIVTTDEGQVTHLLISEGWIFKEQRLVPIAWVNTVTDEEVTLHVNTDILKRLPEHQVA
ncbi:MAG: PRC-barrel domain-containing protein [Caldilineaceae bacterium]|nr:PRC-barrel domain-containing protein [Caldilineaceae bacterium]